MNRILRELHAAADKEQLLLERGEYKLSEEAGLPLLRVKAADFNCTTAGNSFALTVDVPIAAHGAASTSARRSAPTSSRRTEW